jgi:hypothetical protein
MRVVRVLLAMVAILVALPLLLGGVALWAAMQHRAPDGSFTAPLAPIRASGYAVVVPDVDGLLRREAPFVRGGQTTLRFTARTSSGPAFIGLAPRSEVEQYLDGVDYSSISEVRLARGGLPVTLVQVPGDAKPASPPVNPTFWVASSTSGSLFWSPSTVRGHELALVVMNVDGSTPAEVRASAAMTPQWLDPTTWGLLILGTVAFLIGMVLMCWPRRQREIVYVVEPSQVSEIAARLGVSTEPLAAALGGHPEPLSLLGFGEEPEPVSAPPATDLPEAAPPEVAVPEVALPEAALSEAALSEVALPEVALPEATPPEPAQAPAAPAPAVPAVAAAAPVVAEPAGPSIEPPSWLLDAGPVPAAARPGTHRSITPPPPITPSFVWPPAQQPEPVATSGKGVPVNG